MLPSLEKPEIQVILYIQIIQIIWEYKVLVEAERNIKIAVEDSKSLVK